MIDDFDTKLATFVAGCARINHSNFPNSDKDVLDRFSIERGPRYIRVVRSSPLGGRAAHCFVEIATGDVFRAENWYNIAKRPRGNIADAHSGLDAMGVYGVNKLQNSGPVRRPVRPQRQRISA